MTDKRPTIPTDPGFFSTLANYAKLVLSLMADGRVSPLLKLLPVASILYVVLPLDLMPMIPVDDIAVVAFLNYLFIEMCPTEVVDQYRGGAKAAGEDQPLEGQWRDVNDSK